jgi:hypothetical protein
MNILIFNWRDIKNLAAGGAEVFTHENAKRWVEKGNEVTLFTSAFPGCRKEEVVDGAKVIQDGRKYAVLPCKSLSCQLCHGRLNTYVQKSINASD